MRNSFSYFITGAVILLAIILFESFQQHYYITTFDLVGDRPVSVVDLFWGHLLRWMVWAITALFLFRYLQHIASYPLDRSKMVIISALIFGLILADTFLISLLTLYLNNAAISRPVLLENITFFIYQKGPIFMVAYLCLTIFVRFYYKTKNLVLQIQSLESLKQTHKKAYNQLKKSKQEDASIITVKVGKKVRFIPVSDIRWISSDNYCVKIFTKDQRKHTLRSSMKKMESILPSDVFVRVHRTAIVNMEEIEEVFFTKSPYLKSISP